MSTDNYLDGLTIDQLRYARDEADKRIKKAEESPKKLIWQVDAGFSLGGFFKQEEFEKAREYFIKVFNSDIDARMYNEVVNRETDVHTFRRCVPKLDFIYVNEVEYEEYFA